MGSPWKMPTKTQLQELISNTTHEWISANGIYGRKFTSKSDSTKYILLRATGVWNDTNHVATTTAGNYWSTTWYSTSDAYHMNFGSNNNDIHVWNSQRRYGFTIRPVQ